MINKAFKIVEEKLSETLTVKGFTKSNSKPLCTTFKNDSTEYKLTYDENAKQFSFSLRSDNNDFKQLSSWLFDPTYDTEKEAKAIASDFCDILSNSKGEIKANTVKKNVEQSKTTLMFFINRLATIFPELKNKIQYEKEDYEKFREISFVKNEIVPTVLNFLKQDTKSNKFKKFCSTLDTSYANANLDVRSCITIIILNSIEDPTIKTAIEGQISENLKKAWKAAQKYKNKIVKPEKIKKRKSLLAKALESSQLSQ